MSGWFLDISREGDSTENPAPVLSHPHLNKILVKEWPGLFSDQILQSFPQAGSFLTPVLQNQELQDPDLPFQESSLGQQ